MEPDKVVGFEGEANEVSYTKRDLLLYALGIGCVPYVGCVGWGDRGESGLRGNGWMDGWIG